MSIKRNIGDLRNDMASAISSRDVKEIVEKLLSMAKGGDLGAIRLVLFHLVGDKPLLDVTVMQQNNIFPQSNGTALPDTSRPSICHHGKYDGECVECERMQRKKFGGGNGVG